MFLRDKSYFLGRHRIRIRIPLNTYGMHQGQSRNTNGSTKFDITIHPYRFTICDFPWIHELVHIYAQLPVI